MQNNILDCSSHKVYTNFRVKIDQLAQVLTSSASLTLLLNRWLQSARQLNHMQHVYQPTHRVQRETKCCQVCYTGETGQKIDTERERQNGRRRTGRVRGRIVLLRTAPSDVVLKISPSTQPHSIPPTHPPKIHVRVTS